MTEPIYFPIARAKKGEIDAIGRLAPSTQVLTRPMLDFALQEEKDKRPLPRYLSDFVRQITASWGTKDELLLDFSRFEPNARVPDGRHIADYVFEVARQSHLKAVPVVAPLSMRGPETHYFEATSRIVAQDMRGVALRLPYEYFSGRAALERVLGEAVALTSLSPQHIDVYLDANTLALVPRDVSDDVSLAETLRMASKVVREMGFRRAIFIASNMPDSTTRHRKGEVLRVARTEFRAWRRLAVDPAFGFLRFGDYGIVHPGQVESDVPVIPPSRVRITTEKDYVLYKGSRDGIRAVSQAVVADGMLEGLIASWGANAVRECAAGYGDPGGPSQWIARDTNMHFENTVAAIVRYSGKGTSEYGQPETERKGPWLQESIGFSDDP